MEQIKYKQMILMRTDLNMRRGKQIAQAAHASMGLLMDRCVSYQFSREQPSWTMSINVEDIEEDWLFGDATKVTVGVSSEADLLRLVERAKEDNLPTKVVVDQGKTEFHGKATITCAAIGPGPCDVIDQITGGLKLL